MRCVSAGGGNGQACHLVDFALVIGVISLVSTVNAAAESIMRLRPSMKVA